MYSLAVVSARSQLPLFLFIRYFCEARRCADFISSAMLYNLFARDPAPYKCSDQTRTICVNTKAERHVVAKSGDTTIPLPFKYLQFSSGKGHRLCPRLRPYYIIVCRLTCSMITLVLGDSHVFWLERFRKEQRLVIPNLCMRAEDLVGMLGIRGGTVPSLKSAMTVKSINTFARS